MVARGLATAVVLLLGTIASTARAGPPPLHIAYLSGNAGEIDPCG